MFQQTIRLRFRLILDGTAFSKILLSLISKRLVSAFFDLNNVK